jgi:hypothetical protein
MSLLSRLTTTSIRTAITALLAETVTDISTNTTTITKAISQEPSRPTYHVVGGEAVVARFVVEGTLTCENNIKPFTLWKPDSQPERIRL